jgi:hypothetical protein
VVESGADQQRRLAAAGEPDDADLPDPDAGSGSELVTGALEQRHRDLRQRVGRGGGVEVGDAEGGVPVVGQQAGVVALVPPGTAAAVEDEDGVVRSLADPLEQSPGEPVGANVHRLDEAVFGHGWTAGADSLQTPRSLCGRRHDGGDSPGLYLVRPRANLGAVERCRLGGEYLNCS